MNESVLSPKMSLNEQIRIGSTFTRSINLTRDSDSLEMVRHYLPTSRALVALEQIAAGLNHEPGSRALALVGPYGSGKSAFALFLSALLSGPDDSRHQAAIAILERSEPFLAGTIRAAVTASQGYMRVQVNGIPDSLSRQFLKALATAAQRHELASDLVKTISGAGESGATMDRVIELLSQVQQAWLSAGGIGVLIEIDELGKFLEFESQHPQYREIHLLQLLAEKAAEAGPAPLQVVVMLHQAFEHYSNRLGKNLREEWQKVQGRFGAIAFLEPAEQSLRLVGAAFEREINLSDEIIECWEVVTQVLSREGALPLGLEQRQAQQLFENCYPLHPLTLLILPILCQKMAQNERTLFSYLSSGEIYGLRQRLSGLSMGDWIGPWELYDYFVLNHADGFSDPLTYHRWVEVVTALERFETINEGDGDDPGLKLLKTIGLLNLIGAQRGLKASRSLLELLFGQHTATLLDRIEQASLVNFRRYSGEYRVWQGSDFDLFGALREGVAVQAAQSLVTTLNNLRPLRPVVARRATIETGTLRSFEPMFTSKEHWPLKPSRHDGLVLWFYLADAEETPDLSSTPQRDVVAVCRFTERLQEVITEWMALKDLPQQHAALHQDPVAQREHQSWLQSAETEAVKAINALLEAPENLDWYIAGERCSVSGRRQLQEALSRWVADKCYPKAPLIRNELINRDRPSTSAVTGRKRLFAAMLENPDRYWFGIEKTPAEKSLYLSLLKATKLHRVQNQQWGFHSPTEEKDPCRLKPMWDAITDTLGNAGGERVAVPDIYQKLQQPPYGVRRGVLPIFTVVYLLANRHEVALYQEDGFCEELTIEHVELLCRRPELFALERFELSGLRAELFDRYISEVVGNIGSEATLLDIAKPLVKFYSKLPEYTVHCKNLSTEAKQICSAFKQAKSPGVLLFEALPKACGMSAKAIAENDAIAVEQFMQRLVQVLRELNGAYAQLLNQWRAELAEVLLDEKSEDLPELRRAVAERYSGLDRYTPDRMGLGAFIRRLADEEYESDQAWLESLATLLGRMPPSKWREETQLQAMLQLHDFGTQLRDLERLRLAVPDEHSGEDTLLIKMVDSKRGEIVGRVINLSCSQKAAVTGNADKIAKELDEVDESMRFAILAELMGRFADRRTTEGEDND